MPFQKIMENPNWVQIYTNEFNERLSKATRTSNSLPKEYFSETIKPLLDGYVGERPKIDVRKNIQRWMVIFNYKAWSLIRIQDIAHKDRKISEEILKSMPIFRLVLRMRVL